MNPEDKSSELGKRPESLPSANGGPVDANGQHEFWPFEGSRPPRLTPAEIEELLKLWTEEDNIQAEADLRDMLENGGGICSEQFLRAIEEAARDDA